MHHSFDISIAEKYGVNISIFLNNMGYWIKHNIANEKHFHDGRYWTYNSVKSYSILFPYWTIKQVRTIINQCVSHELVVKGNYNERKYDQTQWHGLTDLGLKLLNLPICPNGQMELPSGANGVAQKGKPIPNINTDINTDKNKERGKKRHLSLTPIARYFIPNENHERLADQLHLDLYKESNSFIDYYRAHGKKMSNWNAAFSNWMRKSSSFGKKSNKKEHSVTSVIRELKEDFKSKEFTQLLN